MNLMRIAAVAIAPIAAGSFFAPADPKLDDPIKQLREGTAPPKTAAEFESAYAKTLPTLIAKPEVDDTALQKIVFRASRPGAELERAALSKVLVAKLADATVAEKLLLLRHIQRIGRDESTAALAGL